MVLAAAGGGLREGMPPTPGLLPSSSTGAAAGRLNSEAADNEGLLRLSPGGRGAGAGAVTGPEAGAAGRNLGAPSEGADAGGVGAGAAG